MPCPALAGCRSCLGRWLWSPEHCPLLAFSARIHKEFCTRGRLARKGMAPGPVLRGAERGSKTRFGGPGHLVFCYSCQRLCSLPHSGAGALGPQHPCPTAAAPLPPAAWESCPELSPDKLGAGAGSAEHPAPLCGPGTEPWVPWEPWVAPSGAGRAGPAPALAYLRGTQPLLLPVYPRRRRVEEMQTPAFCSAASPAPTLGSPSRRLFPAPVAAGQRALPGSLAAPSRQQPGRNGRCHRPAGCVLVPAAADPRGSWFGTDRPGLSLLSPPAPAITGGCSHALWILRRRQRCPSPVPVRGGTCGTAAPATLNPSRRSVAP